MICTFTHYPACPAAVAHNDPDLWCHHRMKIENDFHHILAKIAQFREVGFTPLMYTYIRFDEQFKTELPDSFLVKILDLFLHHLDTLFELFNHLIIKPFTNCIPPDIMRSYRHAFVNGCF